MRDYFAYGANIDRAHMRRCCPDSIYVRNARLPDHEFFSMEYGYASIRPHAGRVVWGALYKISETDERNLDEQEGFPDFYIRQDFLELNAFCYIATAQAEGVIRNDYFWRIIAGAMEVRLPRHYIKRLIARFG